MSKLPSPPAKSGENASQPRRGRRARTSEAKDLVRTKLIETGRELIAQEGETPVSLRMIAKHAHYSAGVIYRYFPNRASLFLAIRDAELDDYVERLQAVFDTHADPEARLRAVADAGFIYACEQANAFGMNMLTLLWARSPQPDGVPARIRDMSPAAARVHALYETAIQAFFADIGCSAVPAEMATASVMAVITGAVSLPEGSVHKDLPERRAVMAGTFDVLIAGWRAVQ